MLGDPLNGGAAGSQAAGRREINWDGVPAALTNNDDFPGDFFNTRAVRGVVFTTPGTASASATTTWPTWSPRFAQDFAAFSPRKTFLAVGSTVTDVEFRVPGGSDPAAVRGFGVVFSDVDRPNSATMEFFGSAGSLGRFEAPVRAAGSSLSFLGVTFDEQDRDPRPHHVRPRRRRRRQPRPDRGRPRRPRHHGRLPLRRAAAGSLEPSLRQTYGGRRRVTAPPASLC